MQKTEHEKALEGADAAAVDTTEQGSTPSATARHTQGPWRSGRPDMSTIVDGYESKWIYGGEKATADGLTSKYVAVASGQDCEWDEVMANAHLIAAAPELLDALKASQAWLGKVAADCEEGDPTGIGQKAMRQHERNAIAIAKAEGRTS